jgi:glyoxylase-like metal-dependent hydrolase (beta-lactamase superfamily II)
MDHIEIPEEHVLSLDAVATGVEGLRIAFVNVFGIAHSDNSWTLIDAGLPMSESFICRWAEKHFAGPPRAIVLSHGHFDHVSSAQALADKWDVPIYAHPLERPYLTGQKEYPPPNPGAGGGLMSLLSPLFPRGPIDVGHRLRALSAGDGSAGESLASERAGKSTDGQAFELPGWQILHTPGHTPGHVSFFREEDRTLLPCDAFCTTKPESFFEAAIAQKSELHGPPAYFTSDWNSARASVQRLAAIEPRTIAPGHGQPIAGPHVAAALRELAARFDEVAVPDNRSKSAAKSS